jgi:hypothetical protein
MFLNELEIASLEALIIVGELVNHIPIIRALCRYQWSHDRGHMSGTVRTNTRVRSAIVSRSK